MSDVEGDGEAADFGGGVVGEIDRGVAQHFQLGVAGDADDDVNGAFDFLNHPRE